MINSHEKNALLKEKKRLHFMAIEVAKAHDCARCYGMSFSLPLFLRERRQIARKIAKQRTETAHTLV